MSPLVVSPDCPESPVSMQPARMHINNKQAIPTADLLHGDATGGAVKRLTLFFNHSNPAITTETMDISLIKMFSEGPLVSLNGSPIVSPTTAAE